MKKILILTLFALFTLKSLGELPDKIPTWKDVSKTQNKLRKGINLKSIFVVRYSSGSGKYMPGYYLEFRNNGKMKFEFK